LLNVDHQGRSGLDVREPESHPRGRGRAAC
jgi:hypothetical protein